MSDNKTKPTNVPVDSFLKSVSDKRRKEAKILIDMMHKISGKPPVMWGPSIIGFGSYHYKYQTGREGVMPQIGFSPRKASITLYFTAGFENYGSLMQKLGKFRASVSCLYINKLEDVDLDVLSLMVKQAYQSADK